MVILSDEDDGLEEQDMENDVVKLVSFHNPKFLADDFWNCGTIRMGII